MTEPRHEPPQGAFGAPYDPPPGPGPNGQQPPGPYGQQPGPHGDPPGPYSPQPSGPYGSQPGPYASQPGLYSPQPGPPYGQRPHGGYGSPPPPRNPVGPGGGNRFRGRPAVIIGAAVAVLLVAGTGVFLATSGGDDGHGKKPVARPSVTPAPEAAPGRPDPAADADRRAAETEKLNAARKPGEAKVLWLQENGVDLPGSGAVVHGPWLTGDIVAKGMYRTVSGYAVADGKEKWSLRFQTDICAAPSLPTTDGKIVIGLKESTDELAECTDLQMIDLRTGKQGWKKKVPSISMVDFQTDVAMSINGGTVTYGRSVGASAYRVSDGKELFGKRDANCQPYAFTSGPRMIAALTCPYTADDRPNEQIQETDPLTGKAKWTYKVQTGWRVDKFYSTDPLVVSLRDVEGEKWSIIALRNDGTYRSKLSSGADNFRDRCSIEAVVSSPNKDGCVGVAADTNTFYMATRPTYTDSALANKVVAFDLNTGKPKWKADSPAGQEMEPLRVEGGKLLVYVAATSEKGGAIASLAPGGGAPRTVLSHPLSAAETEEDLLSPKVSYLDGRSILTKPSVGSDKDAVEARIRTMMAFGE